MVMDARVGAPASGGRQHGRILNGAGPPWRASIAAAGNSARASGKAPPWRAIGASRTVCGRLAEIPQPVADDGLRTGLLMKESRTARGRGG